MADLVGSMIDVQPAKSGSTPGGDGRPFAVPALAIVVPLVVVGCINGWSQQVVDWVRGVSANAGFGLPVSLIDVAVLAIALALISEGYRAACRRRPSLVEAAVAAAILVPSGAASWLAVGTYAAVMARVAPIRARSGLALVVGLALLELWNTVVIKWVALEIGRIDAILAGGLLSLLRDDVRQAANVVGVYDHSIVIFAGCTTVSVVFRLLLMLSAVHCLVGGVRRAALGRALAVVVAITAAANIARLAAMASSQAIYATLHGPTGLTVFDGALVLLILAFLPKPERAARAAAPPRPRAASASRPPRGRSLPGTGTYALLCVAVIWLLASAGAKVVRYATQTDDFEAESIAVISAELKRYGFSRQPAAAGTPRPSTIAQHVTSYKKAGCPVGVRVVTIAAGGETIPWLRRVHGNDIVFFEGGSLTEEPTFFSALSTSAAGAVTLITSLGRHRQSPRIAITPRPLAEAGPCGAPGLDAWSAFLANWPGRP